MLDTRGYSCLMPVVMVQKQLRHHSEDNLEVLVDNQCAVENITRYCSGSGYRLAVAEEGQDFRLTIQK